MVTYITRGWLVTHQNCLDGATAGLVGLASGLSPIFTEPDRVAGALSQVPVDKPLYLADVSLPITEWSSVRSRITYIVDHHKTALPLQNDAKATIDLSHSGAALLYRFAVSEGWISANGSWDRLIHMVERYDLWQSDHGPGQDLNRLFRARGFEWYRSRFATGWAPFTSDEADQLAHIIYDETEFIARHVTAAQRLAAGPLLLAGVLLDGDGPVNEVAHTLLERGVDLVLFLKADGRISARTRSTIDAAALMEKHFRGGGHARAAGGRLTPNLSGSPESLNAVLQEIRRILAP